VVLLKRKSITDADETTVMLTGDWE